MFTFIVVCDQSRGKVSLRGDNRVLSLSWFCFKFVLTIEIQTMINFASYFCEIVLHEVGNKSLYLSIINSRQILKGEMRILQTTDRSWRSDMVTKWYWGRQFPRSVVIINLWVIFRKCLFTWTAGQVLYKMHSKVWIFIIYWMNINVLSCIFLRNYLK